LNWVEKKVVFAQQQQMGASLLHSAPPRLGGAFFVPLFHFFFSNRAQIREKHAEKGKKTSEIHENRKKNLVSEQILHIFGSFAPGNG